jgi:two-component system sensor histidine kinase KdpD
MVVEEEALMMDQEPVSPSEPNAGFLDQLPKAEAARQAEQLRKALLDSVVHELRTPLTSIKASVTTLLTTARLGTTDLNELLTIIDEDADPLNLLVGEVLERGRRDIGEKHTFEWHGIHEIIDAARKDCIELLAAHSIRVEVRPVFPAVRADLKLVKKALAQLLENACKYSPSEEPITVGV